MKTKQDKKKNIAKPSSKQAKPRTRNAFRSRYNAYYTGLNAFFTPLEKKSFERVAATNGLVINPFEDSNTNANKNVDELGITILASQLPTSLELEENYGSPVVVDWVMPLVIQNKVNGPVKADNRGQLVSILHSTLTVKNICDQEIQFHANSPRGDMLDPTVLRTIESDYDVKIAPGATRSFHTSFAGVGSQLGLFINDNTSVDLEKVRCARVWQFLGTKPDINLGSNTALDDAAKVLEVTVQTVYIAAQEVTQMAGVVIQDRPKYSLSEYSSPSDLIYITPVMPVNHVNVPGKWVELDVPEGHEKKRVLRAAIKPGTHVDYVELGSHPYISFEKVPYKGGHLYKLIKVNGLGAKIADYDAEAFRDPDYRITLPLGFALFNDIDALTSDPTNFIRPTTCIFRFDEEHSAWVLDSGTGIWFDNRPPGPSHDVHLLKMPSMMAVQVHNISKAGYLDVSGDDIVRELFMDTRISFMEIAEGVTKLVEVGMMIASFF